MSIGSRVFAMMYDRQMAGVERTGLAALRADLLAGATGRVLEIGGGTGANLRYYGAGVELTVTEPSAAMLTRLSRRVPAGGQADAAAGGGRAGVPAVRLERATAERLPFADGSFDCAVSTLVLCSVRDPGRALGELFRVLRRDGQLLFIEHVLSGDPRVARWQHRLNGLNQFFCQGCNCNRDTLAAIRAAGFVPGQVRDTRLPHAPGILAPLIVGTARAGPPISGPGSGGRGSGGSRGELDAGGPASKALLDSCGCWSWSGYGLVAGVAGAGPGGGSWRSRRPA